MSNMFGNLGELAKMMSKAKDIQANLKKFKEEMPTMEFSASSPGCQVRVTVTGDFRIKEISLTDEALKDRRFWRNRFWWRPIRRWRQQRPRRRRR